MCVCRHAGKEPTHRDACCPQAAPVHSNKLSAANFFCPGDMHTHVACHPAIKFAGLDVVTNYTADRAGCMARHWDNTVDHISHAQFPISTLI